MLTCCRCLKQYESVSILFVHLKEHNINTKTQTRIVCKEPSCNKIYYAGSTYKRHLLRDHSDHSTSEAVSAEYSEELELEVFDSVSDSETPNQRKGVEEIEESIKENVAVYIASLKASSLPSSTVNFLLSETRELIDNVVSAVEEISQPILQDISQSHIPSAESIDSFKKTLNVLKDPFQAFGLSSEYQQRKFVERNGVLVKPQQKILGTIYRPSLDRQSGRTDQKEVEETFQYIPLDTNLKLFLSQPGCMSSIIQANKTSQEDKVLDSFRDGCYHKNRSAIQEEENAVDIDIILYNDDFESVNPLGSKKGKHKVLAVYLSVASLPRKYQSKLDNILLVALAKSSLVSKYGIDAILQPIVDDFEHLYHSGIELDIPGEFVGIVKPKLLQAVGDNLALNTVLGFTSSFSANFFCRYCKTHKSDTRRQTVENIALLRTQENVDADIEQGDLSQTGLHRSCALNRLSYYHVSHNKAPDLMHDFLEGILPFELKIVIGELVKQGRFTTDEMNDRIQAFSYGKTEQANRPSPILQRHLINPFGASGQNASQMNCLILYFPLIVGDKVPEDCKCWRMFLVLLEIYKIASSPSISVDGTYYLKSRISEHHQIFLELFPEYHLLPKHHHCVHYPRAIRDLGPLSQYSCMRFEGKHKPFKKWAKLCNNFRNITKTLAWKHQEAQAFKILGNRQANLGSTVIHNEEIMQVLSLQNDLQVNLCDFRDYEPDTEVAVCGHVEINGYSYRSNIMLLSEWTCDLPSFVRIERIIRFGSKVQFLVQPWRTENFNEHYQAFVVSEDKSRPVTLRDPGDILDHRPVHYVNNYEKEDYHWYVPTRFVLC